MRQHSVVLFLDSPSMLRANGLRQLLTTLALAAPPRRAPDVPRMQLSPPLLPDRRSRQRPQYLEQLDPTPLPTDAQLLTSDDASDASSAPPSRRRRRRSAGTEPEEAIVDLWTYQAEGGVAAWLKIALARSYPCGRPPLKRATCLPTATLWAQEEPPCTLYQAHLGRAGAAWGAVANRSQLALWLQYELGLPAAELEPRCMLEQLPLANRGTWRTK